MASVGEMKKKLPEQFINFLYDQFTPGTADKILMGMGSERLTTLRANSLKYDINSLMELFKENNVKFERVSWYKDALVIKNKKEKDIEKLDIYNKGFIYLQSLSSMLPPIILAPVAGEKILDMTAAPGSKTTQMAALMGNKGEIIANELDKFRYERLVYNIKLQGAEMVTPVNGRGEHIYQERENYFDRVLLDAPCSGEGRFNFKDTRSYRFWKDELVNECASIQKKLMASGIKSLKKGGIIVYSTCTLNVKENEEVVNWACENFNVKVMEIDFNIPGSEPGIDYNGNKELIKCRRILPNKDYEGFFACKIKKL